MPSFSSFISRLTRCFSQLAPYLISESPEENFKERSLCVWKNKHCFWQNILTVFSFSFQIFDQLSLEVYVFIFNFNLSYPGAFSYNFLWNKFDESATGCLLCLLPCFFNGPRVFLVVVFLWKTTKKWRLPNLFVHIIYESISHSPYVLLLIAMAMQFLIYTYIYICIKGSFSISDLYCNL